MTSDSPHSREAVEEAAATWIARRSGARWSAADEHALQAWLAQSAGHRVAYYRLNAVWEKAARVGTRRGAPRGSWLAAAAAVIVLLAGAVIALQSDLLHRSPDAAPPPPPSVAQDPSLPDEPVAGPASDPVQPATVGPPVEPSFRQRYVTAIGAVQVVSLPDGSRVTLDTDSRLEVRIDARSRRVRLERGQAFFEVAHETRRPFVVEVGRRLSVVAVGTAFSVRSEGKGIRVVVAEGRVRLERPDDGDDVLDAGGIARIEGEEATQIRGGQAAELERQLSWRSGVLTFRRTPLAEAVAEFNRYGQRSILIRDPQIASLELGGVFRATDAEIFARLLERTFPIDAAIHPDRIELSARRSP